jgi:hypothetical protein
VQQFSICFVLEKEVRKQKRGEKYYEVTMRVHHTVEIRDNHKKV